MTIAPSPSSNRLWFRHTRYMGVFSGSISSNMGAYSIYRRTDIILSDYKGQVCVAGSRIFVQEGLRWVLKKIHCCAARLTSKTGDPFTQGTEHGPQVSRVQFDVCPFPMDCAPLIPAKRQAQPSTRAANVTGTKDIKPTIFTEVHPDMKIVKEEIFACCYRVQKWSWGCGDGE